MIRWLSEYFMNRKLFMHIQGAVGTFLNSHSYIISNIHYFKVKLNPTTKIGLLDTFSNA